MPAFPALPRSASNGRANVISIRGFGPDFSTTTLNGRQQTTTNDSRAVEFDHYPSEILAGVDIYKTAEADHTAGGLVGSIDLRTIRPLDYGSRVIAVGVRGAYRRPEAAARAAKNKGGRVFGTFVDQFAHDTIGVALSAAYTNEPYQTKDWNAWGYGGYPVPAPQGMNGVKSWYECDRLKRFGGTATVQATAQRQSDHDVRRLLFALQERHDQKGFEMPFELRRRLRPRRHSRMSPSSNGLVTAATIAGTPVIENYREDDHIKQYSAGLEHRVGWPQWLAGPGRP